MNKLVLLILLILTASCSQTEQKKETKEIYASKSLELSYATGFDVEYYEGYKKVIVQKPFMNADNGLEYILSDDPESLPQELQSLKIIKTPIQSIVCTSTTHIPFLDYLGETNSLVGFPTTDYISSEKMRERIENGQVTELGVDKEMNIERLVELNPDMVMGYSINGDLGQFDKISQLGISTVMNAEYLEEHPLGRSEWIKFVAAFYNKEDRADSVFKVIEENYRNYQKIVARQNQRPTVLSGIVYGDTWYLPGGDNYAAKLIEDAGGDYLWSSDSTRGFLELSFESVYEKANEATFWIGVASFETLESIKKADVRYANFSAFKTGEVYTNNWRKGAKGGSEFLELGYLRPDLILADLIKIFHPEVLPEHELYFHKRLE
ncbi:ABC transporter substrate-binding protein [Fulvivirga lutea]|uniref:ABC transporter substrate-binding protein n=1 Tax=Fulvivirga lutea TaxID=2810512 RepID=A0A974WK33_9BACT|nr:ABC transporter substrate-binding protein [Fulvivirga lutea]QSE97610.1 ABC transporter substrate-binding protein [Fulvivirga lutea]